MKIAALQFCKQAAIIGTHIACFILLSGCATVGSQGTPEEIVTRRAAERLEAMLAGDFENALGYASPAFRQISNVNQYRLRYGGVGNWTGAEVDRVTCDAERCEVRVMVSYRMARPAIVNTRPLDEVWIPVEGQWYIYEQ